jgi:hypothetical protein
MNNQNEKPALYADPQLALEVTRELKANCPNEYKAMLQETFGTLTQRDLIFYSIGRLAGLREAEVSFRSIRSLFASLGDNTQKGGQ